MHTDLPDKTYIQLVHSKQRYNWDCGISCVLMVLSKQFRQTLVTELLTICKEEGFNKSTWTIDLCYLLKRYNVTHELYTVTEGVDPGYHSNTFYNQIIAKDEERIKNRFKDAKRNGIIVHNKSVTITSVLKHLTQGPAIMLINAKLLVCDSCKTNKLASEFRQCLPWPTSYQGHYIILCGYNLKRRKIYYRNPSLCNRVCVISVDLLEKAWRSYGTDEDLILIYGFV
ncbi:hypothetical protein RN001_010946 [Aquatica leii]|uniref:Protein GUCD1 n=1 Tax=Aquatica leii TaxID=1421715 RepID=A0AAN7P1P7_9COLE|nr:hypothetical protein RN001_010946 [Aquatica leii]